MHGSVLYPTIRLPHKHAPKRLCRLVLGLTLALSGCVTHPPAPQPAPQIQTPVMPPATPRGQSQRLVSFGVQLPEYPEHPTHETVAFVRAATSCVENIYLDDTDDSSIVDGLLEQLQRAQSPLLQSDWHPILAQARQRCLQLRALGPMLRPLRQSLQHAWRDELNKTYQNIDEALCVIAQQQWQKLQQTQPQLKHAPATIVTIEPLGSNTLQTFLNLCQMPKSLFDKTSTYNP